MNQITFYRMAGLKKVWISAFLFLFFLSTSAYGVDISDAPMESKIKPAPPNIMFILDNSASMDWEFMTSEDDGTFSIEKTIRKYLFADPGDNIYKCNDFNYERTIVLTDDDKAYWKSQWSGYNKLYFNPHSQYTPWPGTDTYPMNNADLTTPYSNPIHNSSTDPSITLSETFYAVTVSENDENAAVIVDNTDEGFSTYTTGSSWVTYNGSAHNSWLEQGYTWVPSGTLSTEATFTPNIETTEDYLVYVWLPCRDEDYINTESNVTVNHNNGSDSYIMNQRSTCFS